MGTDKKEADHHAHYKRYYFTDHRAGHRVFIRDFWDGRWPDPDGGVAKLAKCPAGDGGARVIANVGQWLALLFATNLHPTAGSGLLLRGYGVGDRLVVFCGISPIKTRGAFAIGVGTIFDLAA